MQYISTVTSKGQVLIPGDIRKQLGIKPLDRVVLQISGSTIVAEKAPSIDEMYGCVKTQVKLSDVDLEKKIKAATEASLIEEL